MNTQPSSPFGALATAMVTPFNDDLSIDYARVRELAQRLVAHETTTIVVAGTTGESPTVSHDEKLQLLREVKSAVDVPVILNVGSNDTQASINAARAAENAGADALLAVVPYYNRPSQEGLFQHFAAIANAVKIAIVLYNLPGRTSRNMEPQTVARLGEIDNIVAVKESSGDSMQWSRTKMLCGDNLQLMSGNDGDTLPMLALGATGVTSVISHIAGREMKQMMNAYWNGDSKTALEIHLRLLPVVDALFPATSSSPTPIKAALKLRGFSCGGLRLPLVEASENEIENLRVAMTNAGLL